MDGLAGLFGRLARFSLVHGRTIGWVAVLLTVVGAFVGIPPKVDSNLINLLPDSDPTVTAIKRINEEEGGLNVLSLNWRADDPARLEPYLDELVTRFEALDTVDFALYRMPEDLSLHVGMLQFEASELNELSGRLQGALALGSVLNPFVTQRLMDMGPLTEKIAKASDASLLAHKPGEAKLIVRPNQPAADPAFAARFMQQTEELIAASNPDAHGMHLLWMGGAYRHTVEDVQGIAKDLADTTFASVALLLGLLMVSFRSWKALIIIFPPLIVANVLTLAYIDVAIGALNSYTSFGTAIIFGLGIDFGIHLVGRYREERAEGKDVEGAIEAAWATTGPPCLTVALTSSAGFLSLLAAEFKGFEQLGVILAVGLMLCLVATFLMLPALIARFDRDTPPLLGSADHRAKPSTSTYALAPIGVATFLAATVVVSALAIPHIDFEYDVSALRREGMAYAELTDEERAMVRQSYAPVVASLPADVDLGALTETIRAKIKAGELPHVAGVVSILDMLPADQAERNTALRRLVGLLDHPNLRYLPPVLVKQLLPLKGLEVALLTRDDFPPGVLQIIGAGDPDHQRLLLMPTGNMWDVREARALSDEVHALLPGQEVAGEQMGVASMFLLAIRDTPTIIGLALLFVTLITWADLRRWDWTLGALLTLVAGMAWAGVALWATGTRLTLVNLTGIPILLGIALDVVVHLSHRLREEGPGRIRYVLRTSGVAAIITTLTNIVSFWSLSLAGNRGIRSLGMLVNVGLAMVTLVGLLVLPLLWAAAWRWMGRSPAQIAAISGKPIRDEVSAA